MPSTPRRGAYAPLPASRGSHVSMLGLGNISPSRVSSRHGQLSCAPTFDWSVLWYRGGIEAWRAAGLPMAPAIGGW
jgi:rhodanese-related sulfurtransferase